MSAARQLPARPNLEHLRNEAKQRLDALRRDDASARLSDAQRLVRLHAPDAPAILRRDFYNSLRAAYTADEVSRQLAACELAPLTVEVLSDRHLLVSGRLGET